jgi:hypothetical protein
VGKRRIDLPPENDAVVGEDDERKRETDSQTRQDQEGIPPALYSLLYSTLRGGETEPSKAACLQSAAVPFIQDPQIAADSRQLRGWNGES